MLNPTPLLNGIQTHRIYAAIISVPTDTGRLSADLTGRVPVQSAQGNNYILCVYDEDSHAVLAEPLKSCSDTHII